MARKEYKQIYKLIKTYKIKEVDRLNRIDLRIVQWDVAKLPALENRKLYFDETDAGWKDSKLASIGIEELKIIKENIREIEELLSIDRRENKGESNGEQDN